MGNRRHGIDDLFRWIVAQQAFEDKKSLDPAISPSLECNT
jgi:hypothetical protein